MNTKVPGAWCRVLGAVLGAVVLGAAPGAMVPGATVLGAVLSAVPGAAVAHAQERIANAKLETVSGSQGLARAVRDVAGRPGAVWLGYQVPMLADSGRRLCDAQPPRAFLEPPSTLTVLARIENGRPVRLRTFTPECDIDAGGMPLVWLNDVKADDSVGWLAGLVAGQPDNVPRRDVLVTPAITAIALHATAAAVPQLIGLARTTKNADIRKEAMAWLGRSRDPQALKFLEELLTSK